MKDSELVFYDEEPPNLHPAQRRFLREAAAAIKARMLFRPFYEEAYASVRRAILYGPDSVDEHGVVRDEPF